MSATQVSLAGLDSAPRRWHLRVIPGRSMDRNEYRQFADANPDLRIERTAQGEVIVMPPAHGRSGSRNFEIARQLGLWAVRDGRGICFDSSTGFDLPNGANRAPDAAWVLRERIESLTADEKDGYVPLCPDFVVEVRSKSDRLGALKDKMQEYAGNGARLGWLIDPLERRVHVYRPGFTPEELLDPASVSGDPELPGFELELGSVWEPY